MIVLVDELGQLAAEFLPDRCLDHYKRAQMRRIAYFAYHLSKMRQAQAIRVAEALLQRGIVDARAQHADKAVLGVGKRLAGAARSCPVKAIPPGATIRDRARAP